MDMLSHSWLGCRDMTTPPEPWSPADHLGAIAMSEANAWRQALKLCAARMRAGHPDPQTDARPFLLALRQFLKAERLGFAHTRPGRQEAQRLDNARARLRRAVRGAKDAGDIIEHFAEYAEGKGDLQPGGALRR